MFVRCLCLRGWLGLPGGYVCNGYNCCYGDYYCVASEEYCERYHPSGNCAELDWRCIQWAYDSCAYRDCCSEWDSCASYVGSVLVM